MTLTPTAETVAICRAIALDDLPAERIWGEFEKLLLHAGRPSIGFALARELGVTAKLLPELHALIDCPQEPEWHPEGDVWVHTLLVIDEARQANGDLDRARLAAVMLGAVCHDLGKPSTTATIDGRIRSLGHEEAGVAPATRLLDRLNVHSLDGFDVRAQVLGITAHHLKPGAFYKERERISDGAFRRLAAARGHGAAGARRARRLPRPHRRLRLLGDGLVHRPRPRAGRRAQGAGADSDGPASDRAGRHARAADGRDPARGV